MSLDENAKLSDEIKKIELKENKNKTGRKSKLDSKDREQQFQILCAALPAPHHRCQ